MPNNIQSAVFGGGCFWCTEAIFQQLKGVTSVIPGYTGGKIKNPSYEQVSSGNTGHAEAVKINFNPDQITFKDLLNVFFSTHNPTTMNRQGNDMGEQYRSVIFFVDENQKQQAMEHIRELEQEQIFSSPIVTQIKPLGEFYAAENSHLNYFNNNRDKPYCQVIIEPKISKLRAKFSFLIK